MVLWWISMTQKTSPTKESQVFSWSAVGSIRPLNHARKRSCMASTLVHITLRGKDSFFAGDFLWRLTLISADSAAHQKVKKESVRSDIDRYWAISGYLICRATFPTSIFSCSSSPPCPVRTTYNKSKRERVQRIKGLGDEVACTLYWDEHKREAGNH